MTTFENTTDVRDIYRQHCPTTTTHGRRSKTRDDARTTSVLGCLFDTQLEVAAAAPRSPLSYYLRAGGSAHCSAPRLTHDRPTDRRPTLLRLSRCPPGGPDVACPPCYFTQRRHSAGLRIHKNIHIHISPAGWHD